MKIAIISYDLKDTQPNIHGKVKQALESFTNAHSSLQGLDVFSMFPRWVNLKLPDTTILATIANPSISASQIAGEVNSVITSQGANVGKIYVAFLSNEDDFLLNNPNKT